MKCLSAWKFRFIVLGAASGAAASTVLGQADLVSRGSAASPSDTSRLAGPVSLADDGANLYVVDRDLGRIVSYALPADASGAPSTTIYGAAGGLSVAGPAGVVMEPTPFFTSRMYIADTNNDRLVILGSVSRLIGQ